jgi:hypothetical protein
LWQSVLGYVGRYPSPSTLKGSTGGKPKDVESKYSRRSFNIWRAGSEILFSADRDSVVPPRAGAGDLFPVGRDSIIVARKYTEQHTAPHSRRSAIIPIF